jgi:hypothetical protein
MAASTRRIGAEWDRGARSAVVEIISMEPGCPIHKDTTARLIVVMDLILCGTLYCGTLYLVFFFLGTLLGTSGPNMPNRWVNILLPSLIQRSPWTNSFAGNRREKGEECTMWEIRGEPLKHA